MLFRSASILLISSCLFKSRRAKTVPNLRYSMKASSLSKKQDSLGKPIGKSSTVTISILFSNIELSLTLPYFGSSHASLRYHFIFGNTRFEDRSKRDEDCPYFPCDSRSSAIMVEIMFIIDYLKDMEGSVLISLLDELIHR